MINRVETYPEATFAYRAKARQRSMVGVTGGNKLGSGTATITTEQNDHTPVVRKKPARACWALWVCRGKRVASTRLHSSMPSLYRVWLLIWASQKRLATSCTPYLELKNTRHRVSCLRSKTCNKSRQNRPVFPPLEVSFFRESPILWMDLHNKIEAETCAAPA